MALKTDCMTPGAVYHIKVFRNEVTAHVTLPDGVLSNISEVQAQGVENELHNALEMALGRYFAAWLCNSRTAEYKRLLEIERIKQSKGEK